MTMVASLTFSAIPSDLRSPLQPDRSSSIRSIRTPPGRPWQWRQRNAYLALLTTAIRAEPPNANIVVVGDWNTPSWSPFYRDFHAATGLLSTEWGRNKSSAKSYAKVERSRNVMQLAANQPVGEAT